MSKLIPALLSSGGKAAGVVLFCGLAVASVADPWKLFPDLLTAGGGRAALVLLFCCLAIASVTDLVTRRIPNWLTGSTFLAAFAVHACMTGAAGLVASVLAFLIWFALGFTFYVRIGGIGAGDIKLIMACAALTGASFTLEVAFVSFALQVLWLIGRWIASGVAIENLRAVGHWFQVLLMPYTKKAHYVAVGTADRSPHAPFLLLGALLVLWLR